MEKDWAVEVWGDWSHLGIYTDIFYTRREAEIYFKQIRRLVDSSKFIITKESIVDIEDNNNAVYLTNLREL